MNVLLRSVTAKVRYHHFIHAILSTLQEPLAGLVQVVDDGPDFEVAITIQQRVVSEVETLEHLVHLISPDGTRDEDVLAVRLHLPQHFPFWNTVIAAMQKHGLCAPAKKIYTVCRIPNIVLL
jgi:hypothetical protein